jgi:hypothetical protein
LDVPYWLCCFSTDDNSLSQWRAYGGQQGFAVEFPGDITLSPGADLSKQGISPGLGLVNVIYDVSTQDAYLVEVLNAVLSLLEDERAFSGLEPEVAIKMVVPFFRAQIERASYRFKHPDFATEREWRLVSWNPRLEMSFRPGMTITPYVEFGIFSVVHQYRGPAATGLPITSVRYGPTSLTAEAAWALDQALLRYGYSRDYCERRGSSTPARL